MGFQPQAVLDPEAQSLQTQLSNTLSSKDVGVAVATLVKQFSAEDPSSSAGLADSANTSSTANGGGRGGSGTFEARSHAAAARLSGFKVQFVQELRSRFLRVVDAAGGGARADDWAAEEDITAPNGARGSVFFVREVGEACLREDHVGVWWCSVLRFSYFAAAGEKICWGSPFCVRLCLRCVCVCVCRRGGGGGQ